MTPLRRWCRFNTVGFLGALLQLSALGVLNRLFPRHYLCTSGAAVELTLLHNFLWHIHYTWPGRRNRTSRLPQCLRFHLSNGTVSLLGNLALMYILVGEAHLPAIPANLFAILCCSAINFLVGNRWVFA